MHTKYVHRITTTPVCIVAGCNAAVQWNGRGRPPHRCPTHREERAQWIRRRSARRARAIEAGRIAPSEEICIEPGCEAPVEESDRARGGRAPMRCHEHRQTHRSKMRKAHRQVGAKSEPMAVKLLPAPKGPGRGAARRPRTVEEQRTPTPAKAPEPARCGCGVKLRGEEAKRTQSCQECRVKALKRETIEERPKCWCGRVLRCTASKDAGLCSSCRAAVKRTSASGQAQAEEPEKAQRATGTGEEEPQRTEAKKRCPCGRELRATQSKGTGKCWRCRTADARTESAARARNTRDAKTEASRVERKRLEREGVPEHTTKQGGKGSERDNHMRKTPGMQAGAGQAPELEPRTKKGTEKTRRKTETLLRTVPMAHTGPSPVPARRRTRQRIERIEEMRALKRTLADTLEAPITEQTLLDDAMGW